MTTSVTDQIWAVMAPIYDKMLELPFIRELQDGTLPKEVFARFVVQDTLYLEDYGRALALLGSRLGDQEGLMFFAEATTRVINVEREMHGTFLGELGITPEQMAQAEKIPSVAAYTSWVKQAVGMGRAHEGLGAVLPCFWVYRDVGRELARRGGSPDPVYQRWIDKYSGEAFGASATAAIELAGRVGAGLDERGRAEMVKAAHLATRYEWMLWSAVYEDERWPV
ncbi:MAG TPA: TenA family protein [Nonomuraea sp.]|nr:TenA family protein [Nonomuraea sp.]